MSHHHDIYSDSGPPYSFTYYAYKSKLYFLHNAVMMIFFPLLKSSPHTHTHTHKLIYKKTNKKQIFLLGQSVATLATHRASYILETISDLLCNIYLHTHT